MQDDSTKPEKSTGAFRYYDFVIAAFVAVLLCSNLIGAAKVAAFGAFTFGAGILFFPISYVIGDILTEVYGYAGARRAVWAGFAANLFAALMAVLIVTLPPAEGWGGQEHYAYVFGQTPRIVIASLIAFWAGEFANAYVMAQMKILSEGKDLWQRTIGSTVIGQGVDSLIFYPLAFLGVWSFSQILQVMMINYILKVAWEALLTPVTYYVINRLKKAEGVEIFDRGTNFSPFSIRK